MATTTAATELNVHAIAFLTAIFSHLCPTLDWIGRSQFHSRSHFLGPHLPLTAS